MTTDRYENVIDLPEEPPHYLTTNEMFFKSPRDSVDTLTPVMPGRHSEPLFTRGHRESRNMNYARDHTGTVVPAVKRPSRLPPLPNGHYRVPRDFQQSVNDDLWTPPQNGNSELQQSLDMSTPISVQDSRTNSRPPKPPGSLNKDKPVYRAYVAPPPLESNPAFRPRYQRKPQNPAWTRIPASNMDSLLVSNTAPPLQRRRHRNVHPSVTSEYQSTIDQLGANVVTRHLDSFKSTEQLESNLAGKKELSRSLPQLDQLARTKLNRRNPFKRNRPGVTQPRITTKPQYHSRIAQNPIAERLN